MKINKSRAVKAVKITILAGLTVILVPVLAAVFMSFSADVPLSGVILGSLPNLSRWPYYMLCAVILFLSVYFFVTDKSDEK